MSVRFDFKKWSIRSLSYLIIAAFFLIQINTNAYAADNVNSESNLPVDQARYIISNYYISSVPDSIYNTTSIKEMVGSLKDPHSQYFTKDEYDNFLSSLNMKFSGIGVQIDMVSEGVKIISVISGSPAEDIGLKAGDIIIESDGHMLTGMSYEEAVSYIKGPEGTDVTLKVKRNNEIHTYNIKRRIVTFRTVEGKLFPNGTAYISISSFGEDTASQFRNKVSEFNRLNVRSYIVDLRDNGGGYLESVRNISGTFIGSKPVVLIRDRDNNQNTLYSPGDAEIIDKPVILLVNGYSASASEILAAVVKDYKKAFLIGTRSYGKGTVQSMFQLSDMSVLKLTVQRFYSPKGNIIDKVGVLPDLDMMDMDSLTAAEVLSGQSHASLDKEGFVKIRMGDRDFEIDLEMARLHKYWATYKYIMEKAASSGYEVSIGTKNSWVKASAGDMEKLIKLIYPEYIETAALNDTAVDKKFTVVFSDNVYRDTINSKNIELINSSSGERIDLNFEFADDRTVKALPKMNLESGQTYYLVISTSVCGNAGSLKEGTVTKVMVR